MHYLRIFTKSFLSLFAIMRLTGISCRSPFSIIAFIIIIYIFAQFHSDRVEGHVIPGDITLAALLGALFAAFTVAARYTVILDGLTSRLFSAGILLLTCAGLLVVYYYFTIWFLQTASRLDPVANGYSYFWVPCLAFAACIICWLPYFLYEYPGVMTPDSINQYAQVIDAYELSNHHPVVHTALIGLFYDIGLSVTGSAHTGIALYTFAQMVFMALAAAYVVRTLQKASVIFPVQIIVICFYALIPYNGIFSVTVWKDVPFAGFMAIFAAALMRFGLRGGFASSDDVPKLKAGEYFTTVIPYIISSVMLSLLRTNGWYAIALSIPFILVTYRRCPKIMITIHAIIISLVIFVKYPVMYVYEIPQADFVESVSIPAQQIARVIYNAENYGERLSENDAALIGRFMDVEQAAAAYQPDVSDNIKSLIRQTGNGYIETHKWEFLKVWFSVGLGHPKAYLDAYIAQTCGYWYPDVNYEAGLADGIFPNEFGLSWQPVLSGKTIVKAREILFKLHEIIPIYGLLWSMGFVLWLILLLAVLSLRMRRAANALVCLPFILLYATLLASTPVATEFRYAYAAFYALPLLVMSPFVSK